MTISLDSFSNKFKICWYFRICKIGQGQPRVINCVELEFIMLRAKFHDHRTISSVGKDF